MNSVNWRAPAEVDVGGYRPGSGPLADVNREFHETYEQLVSDLFGKLGHEYPVIMTVVDDLTLFDGGSQRSEQFIPEVYHQLKAVSHVAFGAQLALTSNGDGPLNEATARRLQAKLALISIAQEHLQEERLPGGGTRLVRSGANAFATAGRGRFDSDNRPIAKGR